MKTKLAILSTAAMLMLGCAGDPPAKPTTATPATGGASMEAAAKSATTAPAANSATAVLNPATTTTNSATPETTSETPAAGIQPTPVPIADGAAELGPQNSRVQFVGTHVGPKPDPRVGGFEKFTGKLTVADGKLTGVSFEISTDSLWTQIGDKLTTHLKSPDFLDIKEFPEIKFQSTQVEAQDDGKVVITGDLTLHGVTKSVSVPSTVGVSGDGVTLIAEFTIDRSEFGMTTATDKVEKTVSLTVVIGEKTARNGAGSI